MPAAPMPTPSAKTPVLFIHDGGVDDYLALALLLTIDHIDLRAIVVTPADCYIKPAVSATRKILDLAGRSQIPVAESTIRGLNPFPRLFRRDAFTVDHLPVLNERDGIVAPRIDEPGQHYVARLLSAVDPSQPWTVLETGPFSTLAAALDLAPGCERGIREILWMGGALDVRGNIDASLEAGQDGSAEWNVYFDPPAAARVFESGVPITLCPLDLTNRVPITSEFVRRLCRMRRHPLCELAASCYALVMHQDYFAWDVLTTAALGRPDLFRRGERQVELVVDGPSQGRTRPCQPPAGRRVEVLTDVDLPGFYAYLFDSWTREPGGPH